MTDALITILMACRDTESPFVAAAIESVLAQTTLSWQLLLIHDRGTNLRQIPVVRGLIERGEPRVEIVQNEGVQLTGALNTGMRRATTPYVCMLHADDLLDRRAIGCLTEWARRHPDVDYFYSARMYIDENGAPLSGIRRAAESFTLADFRSVGPVKHVHCWKVTRALAIGGMDETLGVHGADDYDFPWRMAEAGCAFRAIPECLYYYRDHRRYFRLTTHVPLDRQLEELTRIWKKHGLGEDEIARQIERRTADYLRQALFRNEADRVDKERAGYDIRTGWRQSYR